MKAKTQNTIKETLTLQPILNKLKQLNAEILPF